MTDTTRSMKDTFEGLLALQDFQLKTSKEIVAMRKARQLADETSIMVQDVMSASMIIGVMDQDDASTQAAKLQLASKCRSVLSRCLDNIDDGTTNQTP